MCWLRTRFYTVVRLLWGQGGVLAGLKWLGIRFPASSKVVAQALMCRPVRIPCGWHTILVRWLKRGNDTKCCICKWTHPLCQSLL